MKRTLYWIVTALAVLLALGFVVWQFVGIFTSKEPDEAPSGESQVQEAEQPSEEVESAGEPEQENTVPEYSETETPRETFPVEDPPQPETDGQVQEPATEDTQAPETEETVPETTGEAEAPEPPATFAGSGDENELPPIPF